ncbi:triokinase/FMN cyclase-like isoform X2 [Tubulanus polymorphus]|uniref:triokinase/FMN cyclase-like isoform X2 n=1 Tax=Tubulanus polymorphus TaxID=672921 RepID=UPI003DA2F75B
MAEISKKIINEVDSCVDDCLEGIVACNPGLKLLEGHRVVIRADVGELRAAGKVCLISGGGSGHEPAHAGYVGKGMLTAAVAGAVFSSPPPDSILAAIRAAGKDNPGGILLIVKNYTGDKLNFGIASERAKTEGILVEMIVVGEDCALTTQDKTAGRRGLCGTVLIHKIAGAMAEANKSLMEILRVTRFAVANMGTIGLSLSPCSLPGFGPTFNLAADEMELGLGIHGEAGVRRMKLTSAKEIVRIMFDHMTDVNTGTHLELKTGDQVCLVVNNLGGTSMLELNIVAKEAVNYLENLGVQVDRMYCGVFMTSLDMSGVSLTLLHLDSLLKKYLDATSSAFAWMKPMLGNDMMERITPDKLPAIEYNINQLEDMEGDTIDPELAKIIYEALHRMCTDLIDAESRLNYLDTEAGDGDCGTTHKRGAESILEQLGPAESPGLPVSCPHDLILKLAKIVEQSMGGSSGALYSLFLSASAPALRMNDWLTAFQQGIAAMSRYGGAEQGDRTMETEAAAQATEKMRAQAGRASYVSVDRLNHPDPGAVAVSIWIKSIAEVLKQHKLSASFQAAIVE